MKIQYKIAFMAAGLLAVTSCAKHDPLADLGQMGYEVPTCYWSVGSSACKAGEEFTFKGMYYTATDATPDHSEVWYSVKREEGASASVKLAGSSLKYTKSTSRVDTVRDNQVIAVFPHSEAEFDAKGNAFVITGSIPTSRTLAPVDWNGPRDWDQNRFNSYFPQGFDKEFIEEVVTMLTKDSTYYNALRTVYINYNFTNAQFAAMNAKYNLQFPTDINITEDPQSAVADKSDRWHQTTEASDDAIIGWYYKYVDGNGNTVVHEEKGAQKPTDASHNWYPVYDSAAWVFCRYDDDAGAIVRAVRAEYMPAFIELLNMIPFTDWIYDNVESNYAVTFSRKYSLDAQFKVYDSNGRVGTATDTRNIQLN